MTREVLTVTILSTETVESATGSLEGIDNVERSDGFAVNIPHISITTPNVQQEGDKLRTAWRAQCK
jgi:hypothetical protein